MIVNFNLKAQSEGVFGVYQWKESEALPIWNSLINWFRQPGIHVEDLDCIKKMRLLVWLHLEILASFLLVSTGVAKWKIYT